MPVVDVTHLVPAHDVRAGALTLWRAAPWLVPGVILGVVDPGVGTARRAVAVEVAEAGAVLVGPDNGLLLPAAHALGRITAAVELDAARSRRAGRGVTFAGRDLFAPVSARIALGADLAGFGRPLDPAGLAGDPVPAPQREPTGRVCCEVLWIDRFGNVQLNAGPADVEHLGAVVALGAGATTCQARLAGAFAELDPQQVGLVTDSYGLLAVSLNGASAAALLGIRPGDRIFLDPP